MPAITNGPRRRQIDRRNEAERRLVEAAAELIGEAGPRKMTLTAIGQRAGYSRSLTAHHFGSKGALVRRIVDDVTADFHDQLAEHVSLSSASDAIEGIVNQYLDALAEGQPLGRARVAIWADAAANGSAEERAEAAAGDQHFKSEIEQRLSRGIAAGELPSAIDVAGFARVLIGLLRGLALQKFLDDALSVDLVRAEALALVRARLGVPPDGAGTPP